MKIALGIIMILLSLAIIVAVIFQRGSRKGLSGAIAGGADTFLSKNRARTADDFLPRLTKYMCIAFLVLAIVANFVNK